MEPQDNKELSRQVQEIWDANAAFWDDYMGEGNDFQLLLINPTIERLMEVKPDQNILEVACGNGSFSRRMAKLGAQVTAFDFSSIFIERARERTVENADRIEYRIIDATQRDQLLSLGTSSFDAAVCNMALMDMADIDPLLETLPALLKPGGRFVFSITHPCFNSVGTTRIIEQTDQEGELVTQYAVKVFKYITPMVQKGLGVIGQTRPHYYFDRPLSLLLNSCFRAGFVLDRLEEPVFSDSSKADRPFSWDNFREIPPVLVCRLKCIITM